MTAVDAPTTALEAVTFSLYRDIHKGIRKDLFSLVDQAGSVDPSSRSGRVDVADHLDRAVNLLTVHAHHEDSSVGPVLEREAPALAEEIEHDHEKLDARLVDLQAMARDAVDATSAARREAMYRLYVELAAFTSCVPGPPRPRGARRDAHASRRPSAPKPCSASTGRSSEASRPRRWRCRFR